MALTKPTFSDILAGADFPQGAQVTSKQITEWLSNHRLSRVRSLSSWRRFIWDGSTTGNGKRVWFCGAVGSDGARRPQWVSTHQNGASPITCIAHRDFHSDSIVATSVPNSNTMTGMFGCTYGTRQGLWSVDNASGHIYYWPTDSVTPVAATPTNVGAVAGFSSLTFCAAYPGPGANARMIVCGSGYQFSVDDGISWTPGGGGFFPIMAAAALYSWCLVSSTAIWTGADSLTIAPISATPSSIGIGTAVGVIYDTFAGVYRIWGSTGHAWSLDGITWTRDTAAPLNGKDIRAFGCSDDGVLIAVTPATAANHSDVWGSFDGASNWVLLTRIPDTVTNASGGGRLEYGCGRFVIPCDSGIYVSDKVAL